MNRWDFKDDEWSRLTTVFRIPRVARVRVGKPNDVKHFDIPFPNRLVFECFFYRHRCNVAGIATVSFADELLKLFNLDRSHLAECDSPNRLCNLCFSEGAIIFQRDETCAKADGQTGPR